ncbi:MAG: serine hydrolase [Thermomicrobiales bacterium]
MRGEHDPVHEARGASAFCRALREEEWHALPTKIPRVSRLRRTGQRCFSRRLVLRGAVASLSAAGSRIAGAPAARAQSATPVPGNASIPRSRIVAAIERLDELTRDALARTPVPGLAMAVVHDDEVVDTRGYGVREAAGADPVDADTIFPLASMSKPITSTIVAALVSEKLVDWDDRVADLNPGFEMYDPWVTREVRVRDFLSHRSGLPEGAGDVLVDLGIERDELMRRVRYIIPDSSFRSQYAYCNVGYTAGAIAAAMPTGLSWEDAAETFLYAPAGMTSTSSRFADLVAAPNHAVEHVKRDGEWVHLMEGNDDAESPAGGVSSNVVDLARWMRLQLGLGQLDGERLISAAALGETRRPRIVSSPHPDPNSLTGFYGLGWDIGVTPQALLQISHSGAFNLGAATTVYLIPDAQIGIVMLTNAYPIGLVEGLAASFIDLALTGTLTQDWMRIFLNAFAALVQQAASEASSYDYASPPAAPAPAWPAETYLGRYANDLYGEIEIVEAVDGLAIVAGPNRTTYPLLHFDGDVFSYEPVGENAFGVSGVIFTVGPGRQASAVLVDQFNAHGQGTFARSAGS